MKNSNVKSKSKSFITPIYTFLVIVLPSLLLWIFFSKDFSFVFNIKLKWWFKLIIAFIFVISTFLLTLLLIYFKILNVDILFFSLPISICFMAIFATDELNYWIRAIILIPCFLLMIPIILLVKKIKLILYLKQKRKNNDQSNEKIIGHK